MAKFGVYAGFLKVSPKIKTFVCNVLPDTTLYPAFFFLSDPEMEDRTY